MNDMGLTEKEEGKLKRDFKKIERNTAQNPVKTAEEAEAEFEFGIGLAPDEPDFMVGPQGGIIPEGPRCGPLESYK